MSGRVGAAGQGGAWTRQAGGRSPGGRPGAGRRRHRWILAAALLALVLAGACRKTRSPIREASGWLETEVDHLDFGATTLGVPVTRALDLTARGLVAADLVATALDPATAAYAAAPLPSEVTPDGLVLLELKFTPLVAGPDPAKFTVRQTGRPELELTLAGRGVDARVVPENSLEFGRPALGAVRRRALSLRNDFETPVPVTLQVLGPDAAEFSLDRRELWVAPFSVAVVPVAWQPQGAPGVREAELELVACPLCAPERLPMTGEAVAGPLVASPNPVVLGDVPFDAQGLQVVTVTNATDEVITIDSVLLADADPGFDFSPWSVPYELGPLDSVSAALTFSPVHAGAATASMDLHSDAEPTQTLSVPVLAGGGGAQLVVTPGKLDFKATPAGARRGLVLTLQNAGDTGAPSLHLGALAVEGAAFALLAPPPAGTTLPTGSRIEVTVVYQPMAPGSDQGLLRVPSDDPLAPEILVPLSGTATTSVVCELGTRPASLDFGGVRAGKRAVLGVKVVNVGADVCALWNERVEGDSAFSPAKVRPLVWLEPGGEVTMPVAFAPPAAGRYRADLAFDANTATGALRVALAGGSDGQPCLSPEPSYLDFGSERPECRPPELIAAWRNRCTSPLVVTSITLGDGTDPGAFVIASLPSLPATVPGGGLVQARIRFVPKRPGTSYQALFAQGSDAPLPVLLPLQGATLPPALHDETRFQPVAGKLDVLLVLDNTASMKSKRAALQSSMAQWLAYADAKGLDYHLGTTTTGIDPAPAGASPETCEGGVQGGEAGRLFPVDRSRPRVVTPATPDRAGVLAGNLAPGGCQTVKQGLEATLRALSPPLSDNADHPRTSQPLDGNLGFARDDARLAVVVWSDDDDQSAGSLGRRLDALAQVRPATPMTFNAVVAPVQGCPGMTNPGTRYVAAAARLGGFTASVCDADWSEAAKTLVDDALRVHTRFPLEAAADPASVQVSVNGAPASGWTYDAAAQAVVFSSPPAGGATVRITYQEPCPVP